MVDMCDFSNKYILRIAAYGIEIMGITVGKEMVIYMILCGIKTDGNV